MSDQWIKRARWGLPGKRGAGIQKAHYVPDVEDPNARTLCGLDYDGEGRAPKEGEHYGRLAWVDAGETVLISRCAKCARKMLPPLTV